MRRTASQILKGLELRIARLEKMRRTASVRTASYPLDRAEEREIVDMVNSQLSFLAPDLTYRDTAIDIEEEDEGRSGTTYLLCSVDNENNGLTYYAIVSVSRGDFETEEAYENWDEAKSDFDNWTR